VLNNLSRLSPRVVTAKQGKELLALARDSVKHYFKAGKPLATEKFPEVRGVFVTITENGALRGCIGYPLPVKALGESVCEMACAAAFEDCRFPTLEEDELKGVKFEVSVLSVPEPVKGDALKEVKVGRDGLIIEAHGRSGLLLPQVATEYDWNAEQFLEALCDKASLPRGSWRNASLKKFQAQIFSE